MSKAAIAKLPPIVIKKRGGQPPRELVINDLREGTGPKVEKGDAVRVNYFSAGYGEVARKPKRGAYGETSYTLSEVIPGWRVGLPGMRVGGRRELIVPPKLAYQGGGVQIYVIDLLAVNQKGKNSFRTYLGRNPSLGAELTTVR